MKKKIIIEIILFMLLITSYSGCFETSNNIVNADTSNVYYSDDNNTVLVDCSHMSPNRIVNIIDAMYDDGYEYIGDVQTPWNMAGRIDFYLIFRISDEE